MEIPKQFNHIIQSHLRAHAAWLPVSNVYQIGDYGLISQGVFQKMGNIAEEFNINITVAKGPDASIDFVSASTSVVKLVAGAEVTVIPEGAIQAEVKYRFAHGKSFLVKAPVIQVTAIENVRQVARQLKETRDWERKWRVVWQTYHAQDPAILSTLEQDTEVSFIGSADALRKLNVGDAKAGIDIHAKKELGLKIHGKAGIIALGLFKLKFLGGSSPQFLSSQDGDLGDEVEVHQNWAQDLEDDV